MASSGRNVPQIDDPLLKLVAIKLNEWAETEATFLNGIKEFVARCDAVYPKLNANQQSAMEIFLKPEFRELQNSTPFTWEINYDGEKTAEEKVLIRARALINDLNSEAFAKHMKLIQACIAITTPYQKIFGELMQEAYAAEKMNNSKTFNDFVILPTQRIARYELYLSDFVKACEDAKKSNKPIPEEINALAEQINIVKKASRDFNNLQTEVQSTSIRNHSSMILGKIAEEFELQQGEMKRADEERETAINNIKQAAINSMQPDEKKRESQKQADIEKVDVKYITSTEKVLWWEFCAAVRKITDTLQAETVTANRTPQKIAEKLYDCFMHYFIRAYLLHVPGKDDLLSKHMRSLIVNIDTYFYRVNNHPGIVFKTRANFPGTANKDQAFLSTLETADKMRDSLVNNLFNEVKATLETKRRGKHDKARVERTILAISAMGDKAVRLWNKRASREFYELKIPVTASFGSLDALKKTESDRRKNLTKIVKEIFLGVFGRPSAKLFNLLDTVAKKNVETREEFRENVLVVLLNLYTESYLENKNKDKKSEYLSKIEIFIKRLEEKLQDRNQKGFFIRDNGESLLASREPFESYMFKATRDLSKSKFENYINNLYQDLKNNLINFNNGKIDKSLMESIYVNTFQVLKNIGHPEAITTWNKIADVAAERGFANEYKLKLPARLDQIDEKNYRANFNDFRWQPVNNIVLANIVINKLDALFDENKIPTRTKNKLEALLAAATDIQSIKLALIQIYLDAYLEGRSITKSGSLLGSKSTINRNAHLAAVEELIFNVENVLLKERNEPTGIFVKTKAEELDIGNAANHATAKTIFDNINQLNANNLNIFIRVFFGDLVKNMLGDKDDKAKKTIYVNAFKVMDRFNKATRGQWENVIRGDESIVNNIVGMLAQDEGAKSKIKKTVSDAVVKITSSLSLQKMPEKITDEIAEKNFTTYQNAFVLRLKFPEEQPRLAAALVVEKQRDSKQDELPSVSSRSASSSEHLAEKKDSGKLKIDVGDDYGVQPGEVPPLLSTRASRIVKSPSSNAVSPTAAATPPPVSAQIQEDSRSDNQRLLDSIISPHATSKPPATPSTTSKPANEPPAPMSSRASQSSRSSPSSSASSSFFHVGSPADGAVSPSAKPQDKSANDNQPPALLSQRKPGGGSPKI